MDAVDVTARIFICVTTVDVVRVQLIFTTRLSSSLSLSVFQGSFFSSLLLVRYG